MRYAERAARQEGRPGYPPHQGVSRVSKASLHPNTGDGMSREGAKEKQMPTSSLPPIG